MLLWKAKSVFLILIAASFFSGLLTPTIQATDSIKPPIKATPLNPNTVLTRIAFASCMNEEKPAPIWQSITKDNPDLFLFMGDNIYADRNRGDYVDTPGAAEMKFAYRIMAKHPDFTPFYAETPMLATWDDHDYGYNDAGAEFAHKHIAKDLMLDFFGYPAGDATRSRDGVYHARIFGPEGKRVQIIMLDVRWFRTALTKTDDYGAQGKERYLPSADPNQNMLGDDQWAWLQQQLTEPAELRLIVSPIQVISEAHGWEAWRLMPNQREKLYETISKAAGGYSVILSGDRHVGGLYKTATKNTNPIIELSTSSLNASFNASVAIASEWDKANQIGKLYGPENYGDMVIDWDNGLITLNLKSMTGKPVRAVTLSFLNINEN